MSGIPVMKFTPRNASTELFWRVASRSALRASRYTPHMSDTRPNTRRNVSEERTKSGNGYISSAKAPASGRRSGHGAHEGEPVEAVDDHGLGEVQPLAAAGQPEHRLEQREDEPDAAISPERSWRRSHSDAAAAATVASTMPAARPTSRQPDVEGEHRSHRVAGEAGSRAEQDVADSDGRDLEGGLHGRTV